METSMLNVVELQENELLDVNGGLVGTIAMVLGAVWVLGEVAEQLGKDCR